jgi:2-polyprenyl-6-methoxyphenol hydroxylase-like FAD-dependent oxidoreductase
MLYDVLIIGAGPVGLTLAMRLGLKGHKVCVLEAQSDIETDLRASTFHPPTLDLYDEQGITAQLIESGLVAPTWQVRMNHTNEFAEFDLSILKDHTNHPYRLQCEQWRLSGFLRDYIENKLPNVSLLWGHPCESFNQDASSVVVNSKSSTSDLTTFKAKFLIGCDGARSIVRKNLCLEFEGQTFPETTILATTHFPFQDYLDHLSYINYCWTSDGTFSLLRLKNLWRVSLYPSLDESIDCAVESQSVRRKINQISSSFGDSPILEIRPYKIHQRVVKQYVVGRVLLAGDAAHINSPSGGMGMNGGVHDAFNLADKLNRILKGEGIELLNKYERQRRPIAIKHVIEQSSKNRARMQEKDMSKRLLTLQELKRKSQDKSLALDYLLETSMISGLAESLNID